MHQIHHNCNHLLRVNSKFSNLKINTINKIKFNEKHTGICIIICVLIIHTILRMRMPYCILRSLLPAMLNLVNHERFMLFSCRISSNKGRNKLQIKQKEHWNPWGLHGDLEALRYTTNILPNL